MTLDELIGSNPDPRELKRALVVKMRQEGWKHHQIQSVLGVQSSYISRWESRYREQGISGLRLGYQGSRGYLNSEQRQSVINWIGQVFSDNRVGLFRAFGEANLLPLIACS